MKFHACMILFSISPIRYPSLSKTPIGFKIEERQERERKDRKEERRDRKEERKDRKERGKTNKRGEINKREEIRKERREER